MAELILTGAAGRLEARYNQAEAEDAPIALILHPHPKAGGSMQDRVTVMLHKLFRLCGLTFVVSAAAKVISIMAKVSFQTPPAR
jgi:uncharacterized protein